MTGTLPRRGSAAPTGSDATPDRWPDERIARLAENAARHAPGVYAPAATVCADGRAARVDLDLAVDHGEHLPTVAEAVRRRVAAQVEAHTGLTVAGVTVTVVDLLLPEQGGSTTPPGSGG
ncbi:Asp23/Gls24 family envelope stress response protein [Micromonospora inositola]|uniref:Asp23 family, cell envelope-related function n=1 Tax=Micromonospora inositola TaxID=47865 RepID=A0A1C5JBS9_9ACTN|nr:Asp23/Gls24 family envelope stress response protein [Micromonospora inositola]SCG67983.1 Asp23 family, cell envelope-related function [Micromonospora inositola]